MLWIKSAHPRAYPPPKRTALAAPIHTAEDVQANGVVVPPGCYGTRDWDQRGSRPSHASRIIGYCCVAVLRTEKGNFTDFRLPLKSGHPQHRHLNIRTLEPRGGTLFAISLRWCVSQFTAL